MNPVGIKLKNLLFKGVDHIIHDQVDIEVIVHLEEGTELGLDMINAVIDLTEDEIFYAKGLGDEIF